MNNNLIKKYDEEIENEKKKLNSESRKQQKKSLIVNLQKRVNVVRNEIASVKNDNYSYLKTTFLLNEINQILILLMIFSIGGLVIGFIAKYDFKSVRTLSLAHSQIIVDISSLIFIFSGTLSIFLYIRYLKKIVKMDHSIYVERLTKILEILQVELSNLKDTQSIDIDFNIDMKLENIDNLKLIKLPNSNVYLETGDLFRRKKILN